VALADLFDCFLLDLDGTLYRGREPARNAVAAVRRLRETGRRLVFMTNNSSKTPEEVADKLGRVGFEADSSEVVTSGLVTARMLARRGVATAFVVGEKGIRQALTEEGIRILDDRPDAVDCVIVGWDTTADYSKFRTACLLVQHGASLVATNPDGAFPAADGLWPGAGALLAVVTTTTGAIPEVVGKPHAPLFEAAREAGGGGRPLVVGDRLDTDVAGAARLGWDSLLVLTGITSREDLGRSDVAPTFVGDDLLALFDPPVPFRQ